MDSHRRVLGCVCIIFVKTFNSVVVPHIRMNTGCKNTNPHNSKKTHMRYKLALVKLRVVRKRGHASTEHASDIASYNSSELIKDPDYPLIEHRAPTVLRTQCE